MRTKIALLSFGLVLLSILVAGVMIVERTTEAARKEIGLRAIAIARTVAELKEIQDNLGRPEGWKAIQPIAERIRVATGVEYIVVFDMKRVRYSHPLQDRIGTLFADGDEGPSLRHQEYLSQAVGVLGPSIRAFVPVMADQGTRQVGVVVVGILVPTVSEALHSLRLQLYSSLLVGVGLGLVGSFYLARNIKKNMFSLEPSEIARILEERVAVLQSMAEGVIAIDKEGCITILNQEAQRMTGALPDSTGRPIDAVVAVPGLKETVLNGEGQFNQELTLNQNVVLANFLPIRVDDKVVGAAITFQDKTEVHKLAEELTGVKTFIEALRAQNHESLNKLHTIAGLIQLQKYEKAVDYIFSTTEEQEGITRFLSRRIRNPALAGLLLGKYNRAKELRAKLILDPESNVGELPQLERSGLVVILGNLLENALEAVSGRTLCEVHCLIKQSAEELALSVEDTGPGIEPADLEQIFAWGFSRKGSGRGVGLALVKHTLESQGGQVEVESGNWGTKFSVRIPIGVSPGHSEIRG
ncbi:ATP-binding protein [Acididesulfobacillus acetoxydans]|uniref:ATP-binding protein n=1 Tax=Acididesulfobacillus acetoxydans TaxID=1561005 RepID=UPI003FD8BDD0